MKKQRSLGREARVTKLNLSDQVALSDAVAISQSVKSVEFVGYDRLDAESRVVALYSQGQGKEEVREGAEVDLITAETPFLFVLYGQ